MAEAFERERASVTEITSRLETALAPDGWTFYFRMGSHESDVWVAELERR